MSSLPLPPETVYYDIERDLIDNEPPGLFPEDQFSYWGQVRHVYGEHLQLNIANALAQWYLNLDPRTTHIDDMPEWEEMLGIPSIPHDYVSGVPEAYRRAIILTRYEKGPFTRSRRNRVIEQFISATFGESLAFGLEGIAMASAGRPLYADTIPLPSTYRVYEDVRNFAYEVRIRSDITPDTATMLRELKRITPAPTSSSITINNAGTNVLDYGLAVRNTQPVGHWRLAGNPNDSSGYGNNGTFVSAPTSVAAPGLLSSLATSGGCYDFDGVDDYINVPSSGSMGSIDTGFSLSGWFRMDALPAAGHYRTVISNYGILCYMIVAGGGYLVGSMYADGVQRTVSGPALSAGTTYFGVVTWDGVKLRIYVNGALQNTVDVSGRQPGATGCSIGAGFGDYFDGRIDEVAMHNYALSQAQITELYNQGIGVA